MVNFLFSLLYERERRVGSVRKVHFLSTFFYKKLISPTFAASQAYEARVAAARSDASAAAGDGYDTDADKAVIAGVPRPPAEYNIENVRRWLRERRLGYSLLTFELLLVPVHRGPARRGHWCAAAVCLLLRFLTRSRALQDPGGRVPPPGSRGGLRRDGRSSRRRCAPPGSRVFRLLVAGPRPSAGPAR